MCNGKDCRRRIECANYDPNNAFTAGEKLCGQLMGDTYEFNFVPVAFLTDEVQIKKAN